MQDDLYTTKPRFLDAMFFPDERGVARLIKYISMAKKSLKICVFNFTHNDLAKAVLDRHNNGVKVKIITDDECMNNLGSDIKELASKGIPVRTDNEKQFHMHNKFALIDNSILITGSFNWTSQASKNNQENIIVVD